MSFVARTPFFRPFIPMAPSFAGRHFTRSFIHVLLSVRHSSGITAAAMGDNGKQEPLLRFDRFRKIRCSRERFTTAHPSFATQATLFEKFIRD
jgi:hypothetical protein